MKNTTLCYIEKDNKYLMLYRNKKKEDPNKGKWLGVGGKFEDKESPEDCLVREVKEETGLILKAYRLRAVITFTSDEAETEYMYLYTANDFSGELIDCNEGNLKWIPKEEIFDLNLWEGDREFLKIMMQDESFFTMKLSYQGEKLIEVKTKKYYE